jgi:hypothetical protein
MKEKSREIYFEYGRRDVVSRLGLDCNWLEGECIDDGRTRPATPEEKKLK